MNTPSTIEFTKTMTTFEGKVTVYDNTMFETKQYKTSFYISDGNLSLDRLIATALKCITSDTFLIEQFNDGVFVANVMEFNVCDHYSYYDNNSCKSFSADIPRKKMVLRGSVIKKHFYNNLSV